MAEVELSEQVEQDDERGDLRDQIHGVRLGVEKVRTAMAGMRVGLSDRIREVGVEVESVCGDMAKMQTGLSDRIGEVF